ncbi:MAG: hypothetical protein AAGA32_08305 [Pseudomonadota bacterium]
MLRGSSLPWADVPPPPDEPPAPNDPSENGVLTEYTGGSTDVSGFSIDLDFIGADWTVEIQDAIIAAAWVVSAAIFGDVPSHTFGGQTIDDLAIYGILERIHGQGSVLGFAGPRNVHDVPGEATFDTVDVDSLNASGQLDDPVVHEFFHVLGFGTISSFFDLYDDGTDRYTGALGTALHNASVRPSLPEIRARRAAFRCSRAAGSFCEVFFDEELNTPTLHVPPCLRHVH